MYLWSQLLKVFISMLSVSPDGVPEIRDDQTPGTPGPHLTELVPVHLLSEAAELEVDDRAG
jgi:hypothetical protein